MSIRGFSRARDAHRAVLALLVLLSIAPVGRPALLVAQPTPSPAPAVTAPGDLEKLAPVLEFLRARNTHDTAIAAPNGIDEGAFVELGGIPQWITIRGEDRKNPVLLVLHGGPGDATNLYTYGLFRSWLKSFTVVQWDQRGAGRTHGKNGPAMAGSISLQRLTDDGIALAEHLRTRLQQPRVLLLGHSFGSILGVRMAKARPELFHALVGTGQVGNPLTGYTVAYDALLAKAKATGQQEALAELEAVGRPPYTDGRGFGVQRKWSNRFEGAEMFIAAMLGLALSAPGYTSRDVSDWLDGQQVSAARLVPETSAIPPTALAGEFALPVVVIQGAEDFTTPTSLARSFVESVRAPQKQFVDLPALSEGARAGIGSPRGEVLSRGGARSRANC